MSRMLNPIQALVFLVVLMSAWPGDAAEQPLKELGWLVGNWIDEDQDVDISSSWSWDLGQHFLWQTFTVNASDQKSLNGRQVVTWDPVKKKIRSWIFDSDGGFGECWWSQQDSSWYVATLYTLPDGRKASATHVYTKVSNDSYTFSSEARDVEGKVLPDIGPFKVTRGRKD